MRDDQRKQRTPDERERKEQNIQSYRDDEERPNRDTEDWLETIGPEDMDRERVIENLEDYGWDKLDDDEALSLESAERGSYVEGYEDGAIEDVVEIGDLEAQDTPVDADEPASFRPTEDEVFDAITGEDDLDDEMPTGNTQPSGVQ
ncbi:MAG: hypothetical protein DIU68_013810 [Chloroflexota bacterium]|nr:MAG: hypothetical protein DIU68_08325 [Chloroflexota bacterium]